MRTLRPERQQQPDRDADGAAAAAGALEAELITARAAAAERRDGAGSELDSLVELAAEAGLERRVSILAEQLRAGALAADTWSPLLRDLAIDWRDVLHRHRELMRDLRRAAADTERARTGEREAAGRLEQAAAKRMACEHQLDEARATHASAFERWRSALVQLEVDEPSAEAALELAHDGSPPGAAGAAGGSSARVAIRRARLAVGGPGGRRTAVAATEAEIERLASAQDDGTAAAGMAPRRPQRARRRAAWRLIDFRSDVPAESRSSLEAALEAAGLLDAWVTPSGGIEDPAIADVIFWGTQPTDGRSLVDVLAPVPDQPVEPEVVTQLCCPAVGLGERETGHWVELDGRFALGPLRGRGDRDRQSTSAPPLARRDARPDRRAARTDRFGGERDRGA